MMCTSLMIRMKKKASIDFGGSEEQMKNRFLAEIGVGSIFENNGNDSTYAALDAAALVNSFVKIKLIDDNVNARTIAEIVTQSTQEHISLQRYGYIYTKILLK